MGSRYIVLDFRFFPTIVNPDAAHMDFACLMIGTIISFAVVYCYLYGRKVYAGPVIEITPYQVF